MKIQDIFNLPKNRGGAKLFNRIMNRYGIPKEDSKELKNNIDNSSSGGGGGVKEYYYKILTDDTELLEGIVGLAAICGCTSVLYKRYDDKLVKLNGYFTDRGFLNAAEFIPVSKAFAITGEENDILQQHEKYIQVHMPKGDIFEKLEHFGDVETIEVFKSAIQEITKEEYESMITYKP